MIIDHYSAAIVKEYAITKYINESKTFNHVDNLYCEYAICRKLKNDHTIFIFSNGY